MPPTAHPDSNSAPDEPTGVPSDVPAPSDASRADTVARLFREHNRSLVSYLALRLRSLHEAQEVAQEAYVRMLQLDQPDTESFIGAYLFRVATNLAVDRLRRRGRLNRIEQSAAADDIETGLNQPERQTLARESLAALHLGLAELPVKCREAFLMFRLDGLSQAVIASRLGVTDRMVRHYVDYALVYCRLRIDGVTPEQAKERMKR